MNERMKGIATVFIDIDDTLWWFTENSKLTLRHTFDTFQVERVCPFERFRDVYLKKNLELWDLYHHGSIDKDFLKSERFRYTLAECGYDGDVEQMARRLDDEYLRYLALQRLTVPGGEPFIDDSEKTVLFVGCENSDLYKLCATLKNLNNDVV